MIREPHFSVLRGGVLYFYEGRLDITTLAIGQILARYLKFEDIIFCNPFT
jgi:hypothetical protein